MTMTTFDDELRKKIEPFTASPSDRMKALMELKKN